MTEHKLDDAADQAAGPLRWSVTQRLVFIELRLFWEGLINRGDLVKHFSISVPQASADLARYQALAPENIAYDGHSKAYVATPAFAPRVSKPNARRYLTQLLMLADQAIDPDASWLGLVPAHAIVPRVRRRLDTSLLRPVINAIHQKLGVHLVYQSMNDPEPTSRWIDPHALAFDGFRWHVRAWCHKRSRFADFVLARIVEVISTRSGSADSQMDRQWHEQVSIRIAPSPDLSPSQQKAIELDYGMMNGEISVPMRLCLVYYFEKHLGLDLDPRTAPEGRVQIVWVNRTEIEQVLADG